MKKIEYTNYQKPSDFARFEQGNTTLRIISSGGLVKKHGMRAGGRYVPLGDCTETPDCEQCLKGNEPKQKWIWICMVRPNNDVKILDVGSMIGDEICNIAKAQKRDPQEFDVIINRVGVGLRTKYSVKMGQVKELTGEEIDKAKNVKQFLIKKYFKS